MGVPPPNFHENWGGVPHLIFMRNFFLSPEESTHENFLGGTGGGTRLLSKEVGYIKWGRFKIG